MLRTLAWCLVLCATAAPAFGADWYDEDGPLLFSPGYLPRRGQIFTELSYGYIASTTVRGTNRPTIFSRG
jgi:hypothetical protein